MIQPSTSVRPIRVGFVGAGQMSRQHLQVVKRLPMATVVGVHDRADGPSQEFAAMAGAPRFATLEALLAETKPDVVHVCTPPFAHFDAARAALEAGAHVYVEKPFALSADAARILLDLARSRQRLVCAGHQLLRDRAFEKLTARAADLGALVQVDSHFAFRAAGVSMSRASAQSRAAQLVDILPHPLYTLVAAMERFAPAARPVEIAWLRAGPSDLQAMVTTGDLVGRLSVSLRARPVASTLTLIGTRGSLTCDFVRSIVVGAGNPGVAALEKVLNPIVEGAQLASGTAVSVARRLRSGIGYPGLAELIESFYTAILRGEDSPVSPGHLLRVTELFEQLSASVEGAQAARPLVPRRGPRPMMLVTGARGFLGAEIARSLGQVRGTSRVVVGDDPHVSEWVVADLSTGVPAEALSGLDVVVHAAAETSGGYEAHQRNTIDATRHLLHTMHAAGARRLVLVSSLSVLRPPRRPWERQGEQTPRPRDPRRYGPYTWGKTLQEELVECVAPELGIETRIVRPGALLDWREPTVPGLMGRHLFGRWHLGLGRAGLPIAVCDVQRCAQVIAWCATHFDEAPPVVHVFDRELTTRGALIERLRAQGWNGRLLWAPISVVSLGITAARALRSIAHGRLPERLATWSILRPRRYLEARTLNPEPRTPNQNAEPPTQSPEPVSGRQEPELVL